ncbi:MAG: tRNA (adenosine(37)-N6)-threonylcarbamoyltransferase complex ATPase subunit type 1 TsaE [Ignavibacteriales bacterium]|jgi:tRNA threonylcarbamoyladenosine biosynthesis protein TsaE|nr:tRNA (adenosine(37)-N6)-threonylcarbamoyltransferase complex ATPase subunit type 1 TsaE [Ignavibacteriaceae bacterium]NLH60568.1 tRNA (adenosine(37)-N6)-threonylcarbamoyltransferase complex ATPase subunit type 1 TsaE [Ignavibacteriales bacterium]HOJ17453.1 tRNA (adenosine(37)-N6)-threonylcarbamoyltransferase complex ATPase subunit type 1 TsaE [Ignavibacteriaceae bacterium]HPO54741.1 tRNA (adenosine(37)-N6)-threonylcarbamoyltransferase complex ATPase subunit type 1 TsaE [Ignavibacteriaceae bac
MTKEISKTVLTEFDTLNFAKELIPEIEAGDVIALIGDLGSGKTYFIKAFCQCLGISYVTSPTFTIVNTYTKGNNKIYHFDFYRINSLSELINTGYNDYINDPEAIVFIEWADLFKKALPGKRVEIIITMNKDHTREIKFIRRDE